MPASTLSSPIDTGTKPQAVKHEVQEHLLRRFFRCACDKTFSSFESLRIHANSQHFRNRLFKCETCHTTYIDPARLAKCRKRHRGQFRCPRLGCVYHNARRNSVIRHMKTEHHLVADEDDIPFDSNLSTAGPPRMRSAGPSSSASMSVLPGCVESLLGLPSAGPSDDELFRLSEERRRVMMELTRKEHVDWMGGEDALNAAVPDYPVWTQRDHPYGRPPSLKAASSKHDAESESPSLPLVPELVVSSPEQVDTALVPTTTGTLKAWAQQASPSLPSMSTEDLVPHTPLLLAPTSPRAPISSTTQAWYGASYSHLDSMHPSLTAPALPYPIPSPSTPSEAFHVLGLHNSALFSPGFLGISSGASLPALSSPDQPWPSPVTPHQDQFLTAGTFDASVNTIISSQSSDHWRSQASLVFTSPDPTFGSLGVIPQAHHVQDVKYKFGLPIYVRDWVEGASES
ncbi:hypothetical protein FS837_000934 [Tulasnella sp. UAMH 9824]|nr:hypothetical protein FS837_000934 [Tulasnella sp. UAMH 9824]